MAYQKGLQFFFFKRQIIQCMHGLKAKIKRILNMVSCAFRYVEVKSINKLSLTQHQLQSYATIEIDHFA